MVDKDMEQARIQAEISRHLQSAGLHVAAPWGPYLGWVDIVVFSGEQTDPKLGITFYDEVAGIAQVEHQWCFRVWNSVPGPGPECMEHFVATPEEIVTVAAQFFLGHLLPIEGWMVPLHRHPKWNEPELRLALVHAQYLAQSAWAQVRQETREHYDRLFQENRPYLTNHLRTVSWDEWYACLFVPIQHEDPSHEEILWLRCDLQEAYVVRDKYPSNFLSSSKRTS